jgi:hypothetical protein
MEPIIGKDLLEAKESSETVSAGSMQHFRVKSPVGKARIPITCVIFG